ncbi:hypothetical protein [Mesorhizobium sp. M1396]|uniref:hypothetical protein n=1 Tax=Mesorhizobium sp. M1396 TaxID=2957095 RepID=UPI0033390EFA
MTASYEEDFQPVEEIEKSGHQTKGVDAFSLSLLRAERQMRRLFTYLVFQSTAFERKDVKPLRDALGAQGRIYFYHFEAGIGELSGTSIAALIGAQHHVLRNRLSDAMDARNKIFHGQLTSDRNDTTMLLQHVSHIRDWCRQLANGAQNTFGYDGFQRPSSFKKSPLGIQLSDRVTGLIANVPAYEAFLVQLARQRP